MMRVTLQQAYKELDFDSSEDLFELDKNKPEKLNKRIWFDLAKDLGAKAIYFVKDHPTILFFKIESNKFNDHEIEERIQEIFLKVWNACEIPLFFVELPTEIRIYNAFQKPVHPDEWSEKDRWLKKIKNMKELLKLNSTLSRAEVETGRIFNRFKEINYMSKVDKCLLRNLRETRYRIIKNNIKEKKHVHALIGRSIFIRYLEDRKILTNDYFRNENISENRYSKYQEVLTDKKATYNLFRFLREDFNGNIFPFDYKEERIIDQSDLDALGECLIGKEMGKQLGLFNWAYKFGYCQVYCVK